MAMSTSMTWATTSRRKEHLHRRANTGHSIHTPSDARSHERPNHLRLFQEGWEPRSFQDRHEDAEHIAQVRDMERRNKPAALEFLPRWNEAEKEARPGRKKRTGPG